MAAEPTLLIMSLLALGLASALLNTTVGGGGGLILVPGLILLFRFSPDHAIGTGFVAVTLGSIAATLAYSRQGRVDYKTGPILAAATLPGVILGSFMTGLLEPTIFNVSLGFIVVGFAVLMLLRPEVESDTPKAKGWKRSFTDAFSKQFTYHVDMKTATVAIFLIGFFTGAFGAGGGLVLTPTMLFSGFPVFIALGTVRLVSLVLSVGASLTRLSLGHVNLEFGLWLAAGAIIGGFLGARVVRIPRADRLRKGIAAIILMLGLSLILETLL